MAEYRNQTAVQKMATQEMQQQGRRSTDGDGGAAAANDMERRKRRSVNTAERLMTNIVSHSLILEGYVDHPPEMNGADVEPASSSSTPATAGAATSSQSTQAERSPATQAPAQGSKGSNLFMIVWHMTERIRDQYNRAFLNMMEELRPTPQTAYPQFCGVSTGLFQDGVSYGKIISLVVFCRELALYCMEKPGMGHQFVSSVLGWFIRFYNSRLVDWMLTRNDWDGLEQSFTHVIPQIGTVDGHGRIVPYGTGAEARDPLDKKNTTWRLTVSGMALAAIAVGYVMSH